MPEKAPTRIADLVDFGTHIVQGRVNNRKPLATTRNGKPWFSFTLDDDSADIKVDCFTDAEKFSPQVAVGDVIRLENIGVSSKTSGDRKFDSSRSDYKISIRSGTVITLVCNASSAPPPDRNKQAEAVLSTLSDISTAQEVVRSLGAREHNALGFGADAQGGPEQPVTHVCTLLVGVSSASIVSSQPDAARQWLRLDMQVIDKSGTTKVAVWSEHLSQLLSAHGKTVDTVCDFFKGEIAVLYRVQFKYSERYGAQCSCIGSTRVFVGSDLANLMTTSALLQDFSKWWASSEAGEARSSLAIAGPVSPGRDDALGKWKTMPYSNLGELASNSLQHVLVSLVLDRNVDNATYRGCASCKSALRDSPICSKCQEASAGEKYYWRIGTHLSDIVAHTRGTLFDPHASVLMGMSADEFMEKDENEKVRLLTKVYEADMAAKNVTNGVDGRDRTNIVGFDAAPNYHSIFTRLVDDLMLYKSTTDMLS